MSAAWEKFKGYFEHMTDEQIDDDSRLAEQQAAEANAWLEAVAAWKADGSPRLAKEAK